MKKAFCFLYFFCFLSPFLFSQRVVEVNYTLDNQGNYHFTGNNKAYCTYVLHVEFTTMKNAKADHALPFDAEVKPGINTLFTLSPQVKGQDIQINYKSSYRKGCMQPVVHPDFVYLLPIGPGMEAQAFRVTNSGGRGAAGAGQAGGGAGQDSSYTIRLKMKPDDTIYAARRGVVTAVDVSNSENDAGATTTGSWNFVEIVHSDCSFGQYGVLKKDGALVKPGQMVEAGTPLGLVGGDKFGRGSDVRFNVIYPGEQGNTQIAPLFWTKDNGKGPLKHGGTYTSEFPKNILSQELPKKAVPGKKAPVTKKARG